jgi:hypothetical protein
VWLANVIANVTNRKFEKSANEHDLNMRIHSWGGNVSSWNKVSLRSGFCRRPADSMHRAPLVCLQFQVIHF